MGFGAAMGFAGSALLSGAVPSSWLSPASELETTSTGAPSVFLAVRYLTTGDPTTPVAFAVDWWVVLGLFVVAVVVFGCGYGTGRWSSEPRAKRGRARPLIVAGAAVARSADRRQVQRGPERSSSEDPWLDVEHDVVGHPDTA